MLFRENLSKADIRKVKEGLHFLTGISELLPELLPKPNLTSSKKQIPPEAGTEFNPTSGGCFGIGCSMFRKLISRILYSAVRRSEIRFSCVKPMHQRQFAQVISGTSSAASPSHMGTALPDVPAGGHRIPRGCAGTQHSRRSSP